MLDQGNGLDGVGTTCTCRSANGSARKRRCQEKQKQLKCTKQEKDAALLAQAIAKNDHVSKSQKFESSARDAARPAAEGGRKTCAHPSQQLYGMSLGLWRCNKPQTKAVVRQVDLHA